MKPFPPFHRPGIYSSSWDIGWRCPPPPTGSFGARFAAVYGRPSSPRYSKKCSAKPVPHRPSCLGKTVPGLKRKLYRHHGRCTLPTMKDALGAIYPRSSPVANSTAIRKGSSYRIRPSPRRFVYLKNARLVVEAAATAPPSDCPLPSYLPPPLNRTSGCSFFQRLFRFLGYSLPPPLTPGTQLPHPLALLRLLAHLTDLKVFLR